MQFFLCTDMFICFVDLHSFHTATLLPHAIFFSPLQSHHTHSSHHTTPLSLSHHIHLSHHTTSLHPSRHTTPSCSSHDILPQTPPLPHIPPSPPSPTHAPPLTVVGQCPYSLEHHHEMGCRGVLSSAAQQGVDTGHRTTPSRLAAEPLVYTYVHAYVRMYGTCMRVCGCGLVFVHVVCMYVGECLCV